MSRFSLPLDGPARTRLESLAARMAVAATAAGLPPPSLSFVARAAMEAGLAALERRHIAPPATKRSGK